MRTDPKFMGLDLLGANVKPSWDAMEFAWKLTVRMPPNSLGGKLHWVHCTPAQYYRINKKQNALRTGREAPYFSIPPASTSDKD